jgi:hypothetical protein
MFLDKRNEKYLIARGAFKTEVTIVCLIERSMNKKSVLIPHKYDTNKPQKSRRAGFSKPVQGQQKFYNRTE